MSFRVGQKVVCVDDGGNGYWTDASERVVKGEIYTVTRCFSDFAGKPVVELAEVRRSKDAREWHGDNIGYGAFRFRPLIERKTDISFAHEILRRVSRKQGERV